MPDPAAPTDKEENFYWVLAEISFTKDDVAEDVYDACLRGRSLPYELLSSPILTSMEMFPPRGHGVRFSREKLKWFGG